MEKPVIAGRKSKKITLVKGKTYFWCACGHSNNQPFCDGSHINTRFTPVKFVVEEDREGSLCMCKHTSNPPFCDGSHRELNEIKNI